MERSVDVLVIGGGAAGIRAAIAAKDEGADVLLLSKGAFGQSGSSFYPLSPGWGIQAFSPDDESDDSPEVHLADIFEAAQGVCNPDLARVLVKEAPDRVRDLQRWALPFEVAEDGSYIRVRGCFSSRKRCFQVSGVKAISQALRAQLERRDIPVFDRRMAVRLLQENGECLGAVAVDGKGKAALFLASATILATGGGGQLFRYNLNTSDISGDGHALALEAGAELENMEFFQIGMGIASPLKGGLFLDRIFVFNPPLSDRTGRQFLATEVPARLDPSACLRIRGYHYPFTTRYISRYVDYAIYQKLLAAEGGVFVDLRNVPKGELTKTPLARIWYDWLLSAGFDPQASPLEFTLCAHAFNGGLRIDPDGRTAVPRLFAAGEIAAGPHGADRLGGNMHAACQVFGARAGRTAASTVTSQKRYNFSSLLAQTQKEVDALLKRDTGLDAGEARRRIQRLMWEKVLVARSADSLREALEGLAGLEARLDEIYLSGPGQLYMALSLRNMVTVGEVIARAASLRQESRGSHSRTDFPFLDPRFNGKFVFRLVNGELMSRFINGIGVEKP